MIIKKRVQGHDILLDYKVIEKYPRYTRYGVYKIVNKSKKIFLYTMCLTNLQISKIVQAGYMISDEEVFE